MRSATDPSYPLPEFGGHASGGGQGSLLAHLVIVVVSFVVAFAVAAETAGPRVAPNPLRALVIALVAWRVAAAVVRRLSRRLVYGFAFLAGALPALAAVRPTHGLAAGALVVVLAGVVLGRSLAQLHG